MDDWIPIAMVILTTSSNWDEFFAWNMFPVGLLHPPPRMVKKKVEDASEEFGDGSLGSSVVGGSRDLGC